jgi:hypothetical protein
LVGQRGFHVHDPATTLRMANLSLILIHYS